MLTFKTVLNDFQLDIQIFPYKYSISIEEYEYQKEITIKKSISSYFVALGYEKISLNRIKLSHNNEKNENNNYDYFVRINQEVPFEDAIVSGFNFTSIHYTFDEGSVELISGFLCHVLKTIVQNTPPNIYKDDNYKTVNLKELVNTVQTIFGEHAVGLPLIIRSRNADRKYTSIYSQKYYKEAFGQNVKIGNIPYLAGLIGTIIHYFFCEYTYNSYSSHVELIQIHKIILCGGDGSNPYNSNINSNSNSKRGRIKMIVDQLHNFYMKEIEIDLHNQKLKNNMEIETEMKIL